MRMISGDIFFLNCVSAKSGLGIVARARFTSGLNAPLSKRLLAKGRSTLSWVLRSCSVWTVFVTG